MAILFLLKYVHYVFHKYQIVLNTRDGVANRDARHARAFIEELFSQTVDGVGNGDVGQARAMIEALISQTGDGVGGSVH